MRIIIYSYVYDPEQFLINELAEEFVLLGHQVQVYTGLPNYPKGDFYDGYSIFRGPYREIRKGVEIVRYPIFPRKKGFLKLALNYLSHIVSGIINLPRLKKADVQFVYAPSPITIAIPAVIWRRFRGIKTCLWLQDLWPESVAAVGALPPSSPIYRILGRVVEWIYARLDFVMNQSPAFQSNLEEFHYRGPSETVPNWAPDLPSPEGRPKPDWLRDFPKGFTVTFAGNVGIAQGIDIVLRAALALKDDKEIHFVIVGDGSALQSSKDFVQKNELTNVTFYGRRPLQDMPALFHLSSSLLVCLKRDPIFEKTIPAKVQAYMSASKPILASLDGVGAQVITQSGSGLVSPSEDVNGLVQNLRRMKCMPVEELKKMGNNAYSQFYQNYQKNRIIRQIEKTLESLK